MRTILIVPAFNEAEALPNVLSELLSVAPGLDVLVVDDGSTDATREVALTSGVRVLSLPFNLGVGGALRVGFRYALAQGYDRAVQFDADGQHDPREIAVLLAGIDGGANMAVGTRFGEGAGDYSVGISRGGAMRFLRVVVRILAHRKFSDTTCGFRAFDRATLELFSTGLSVEYMGDTVEALLLACYAGLEVVEVPTNMRKRQAGAPSQHALGLVYRYIRTLVVLITTASRLPENDRANTR